MRAMVLDTVHELSTSRPALRAGDPPVPSPQPGEILVEVSCCGVCHTELDEIEGRTPPPRLPVIPGHQVVGRVVAMGEQSRRFSIGDRVGVAWIFSACGRCEFCRRGLENLCPEFRATGRDADGGYAEFMNVSEDFAFRIPEPFSDEEAAPLLCAGAIGQRSLDLAGIADGAALGLTGFGASAHLVLKLVRHRFPLASVYVFARHPAERAFARELGAAWAGGTEDLPPVLLDAVIDTTPAWGPVVAGLRVLKPHGRLVINAIRKEDADKPVLAHLDYPTHLWMEKEIKSVANVTRADVERFLADAAAIPIRPVVELYPLDAANQALSDLKAHRVRGAKVLRISGHGGARE